MAGPQGNDEKLDYWLVRYVRGKQNHAQPIIDVGGFTFPTSLVVFAGTWLQTYILRKNGIPTLKEYEKHKTILIYSHHIIEENANFLKCQGRPKVKELFSISIADHRALLETHK